MNEYVVVEQLSENEFIVVKQKETKDLFLLTMHEFHPNNECFKKRVDVLLFLTESNLVNMFDSFIFEKPTIENVVNKNSESENPTVSQIEKKLKVFCIVEKINGFHSLRHLLHSSDGEILKPRLVLSLMRGIMSVLLHLHSLNEGYCTLTPLHVIIEDAKDENSDCNVFLRPFSILSDASPIPTKLIANDKTFDPYTFEYLSPTISTSTSFNNGDGGKKKQYSLMEFNEKVVWYLPPEICFTSSYDNFEMYNNPSVDIWSLGCIFGELLLPFPLFSSEEICKQLFTTLSLLGFPKNEKLHVGLSEINFLDKYHKNDFSLESKEVKMKNIRKLFIVSRGQQMEVNFSSMQILLWMMEYNQLRRPEVSILLDLPIFSKKYRISLFSINEEYLARIEEKSIDIDGDEVFEKFLTPKKQRKLIEEEEEEINSKEIDEKKGIVEAISLEFEPITPKPIRKTPKKIDKPPEIFYEDIPKTNQLLEEVQKKVSTLKRNFINEKVFEGDQVVNEKSSALNSLDLSNRETNFERVRDALLKKHRNAEAAKEVKPKIGKKKKKKKKPRTYEVNGINISKEKTISKPKFGTKIKKNNRKNELTRRRKKFVRKNEKIDQMKRKFNRLEEESFFLVQMLNEKEKGIRFQFDETNRMNRKERKKKKVRTYSQNLYNNPGYTKGKKKVIRKKKKKEYDLENTVTKKLVENLREDIDMILMEQNELSADNPEDQIKLEKLKEENKKEILKIVLDLLRQ